MKTDKSRWLTLALLCGMVIAGTAASKKSAPQSGAATRNFFYIYQDKGSKLNHFTPSGWMGDYGSIKVDEASTLDPADGNTCIKIIYTGKPVQGANWAGVYWQHPANNWGDKPGGFDLTKMKRLTFWAHGDKGGEKISEFKVGGMAGEHGDSDSTSIGPVVLSKDWKKYTIDLSDKNLSHVVGGFAWAASRDENPNGFVIYLDEVRFE